MVEQLPPVACECAARLFRRSDRYRLPLRRNLPSTHALGLSPFRGVKRLARDTTIAEHVETAVPRRRQVHFNTHRRLDPQTDPAVLRNIVTRGDSPGAEIEIS
jgi:hypothetical protein